MNKYLLFCLVCLSCYLPTFAQLPANFNLIPGLHGVPSYISPIASDSNCWFAAGQYPVMTDDKFSGMTVNDSVVNFGTDTTQRSLWLTDYSDPIYSPFSYSISSGKILDTPAEVYRSYAECRLLEPLIAGATYTFTMYLAAVDLDFSPVPDAIYTLLPALFPVKNIGAYFSNSKIKYAAKGRMPYTPQLNFRDWTLTKKDTMQYVKLSGTYTASGGEQYLVIGNFDAIKDFAFQPPVITKTALLSTYLGKDTIASNLLHWQYLADLSLVRDTLSAMIALTPPDLGPDRTWCAGDTFSLSAPPYYKTYRWSTGDTTSHIVVDRPGTYWCAITLGCVQVADTVHVLPLKTIAPFDIADTTICWHGSFNAHAPAGHDTYTWSTGSVAASAPINASGTYWVRVGDSCAMPYTDTFKVYMLAPGVAAFDLHDTSYCAGSISLTGPLAPHYEWSTGDTGRIVLIKDTGSYRLRIYDDCGNSFSDSFKVSHDVRDLSFDIPDTSICGSTLELSGPAGLHYQWSTGDTIRSISLSGTGNYTLRVYDACGNSFTDSFRVNRSNEVTPFHMPDLRLCAPTTVTPATTAPHYRWSNGDTSKSTIIGSSGRYQLRTYDDCGNSFSDSFNVFMLPRTTPFHISDLQLCGVDVRAAVSPNTGFHFLWSTGDTSIAILLNHVGTYWVKAADSCGGSYTDTFRVIAPEALRYSSDTVVCNPSGTATLKIPATVTAILWNTGSGDNSIVIDQPGIYYVQGKSGCASFYDTIRVSFCKPGIDTYTTDQDTICKGDCIRVNATVSNYPTHIQWTFPGAQADSSGTLVLCYDTPGNFPVKLLVSSKGGADSSIRTITVLERPQPRFADTSFTLSYSSSMTLMPCAEGAQINWYKNDSLICNGCAHIQVTAGDLLSRYRCSISNGRCADSCTYTLHVVDIPHNVWLPNAFSPNGDARNETFGIITDNPNIDVIAFSIYGRYGERVYYAEHSKQPWNGTYLGQPQEVGSYYWQLRYKVDGSDQEYYLKGDVTLLR